MRQNQNKGFTIIELLVVIAIMGLMATLLVVNFNSTRSRRNVVIAGNELNTNIRKTQSYALSARNVSANLPAKYYVLQFDFSTPTVYTILAVDSNYSFPVTIETINLPQDVVLDPSLSVLEQPIAGSGGTTVKTNNLRCLQILFGLPFGRIYMIGSAFGSCSSTYVNTTKDPSAMALLANSRAIIYVHNTKGTVYSKNSEINGLSGTIISQ